MYVVRHFHKDRPGYRLLQKAVQAHYLKHFNATPEPQPDLFVCLSGPDGRLPGYACIGVTYGDSGKLFSEYYLDQSLDQSFGLDRARIAEIGSFASFQDGGGAGRYLLDNAIKTLALGNVGLVVMTATDRVRKLVSRCVDSLEAIGEADLGRVKDPGVNWGTYYDQNPQVCVARLSSPSAWRSAPLMPPPVAQYANQPCA